VTTRRKLLLLGSLYLAQGLPYGFFTQALPVLLREQGMALPLIGLAHLLTLPWVLKFAWAPLVDAVHAPRLGRRRAVILPLQLASAAVLAALALAATPGAMWPLAIAVLLLNLCAATQDIATDGLAVELLDPDERGLGNGLQVGGYRIGMILGGGLMLVVFDHAGWTAAFLAMSALLLASTAPILAHREPPRIAPPRRGVLAAVGASLARPGMGRWVVVLVTFKTGEWFANAMMRPFLTDQGLTKSDLGVMLGFAGSGAALLGAALGGAATRGLGRRRALLAFGALQSLAIAALALAVQRPSMPMFYAATAAEHFTSSMATAALFTAMMDFSRADEAGTDYTVQASIWLIAVGVASALSGVSAEAVGYAGHFLAAAGVSLGGVLAVLTYRPSHPGFALLGPR
jgi:MFS transporter, PAT family, beta-lactamase induction signal transducer AmpG